ncbi:radical SAM protein [bacterium]|nr:radical SAM protein [bacterium]
MEGTAEPRNCTIVPIIKPVGNYCNLRCDYCFLQGDKQAQPRLMESQLLADFIEQYAQLGGDRLRFIWHGGEPLLAGRAFYEDVLHLQRRFARQDGRQVINQLQTNASLIDKGWTGLFKKHKFRIGVSLDGNADNHNRYRRTIDGVGSFAATMHGIITLRQMGVSFGVIQVLTKGCLAHLAEDFRFFTRELGLKRWALNPYYNPAAAEMGAATLEPAEFTEYLLGLTDLWLAADSEHLHIREFDNFFAAALGRRPRLCSFNGTCAGYLCIDWDGKVYPCDRFTGDPRYLLGDLAQTSLAAILDGAAWHAWLQLVKPLPADCRACRWVDFCHNGCADHRAGGPGGKYYYCATRLRLFARATELMDDYLKRTNQGGER